VVACTAVADDNGMRALRDVAAVAADIEYRIVGGHMVRLLRHVYNVPGIPRLTSDADTGIDVNVASAGDLHDRLIALGYIAECGNRYERGEQAVDLLVPTAAKPGKRIIGERAFDGVPGLRMALALPPVEVAVTARLTDGDMMEFEVPVPDVEAAFVLKMLARTVRDSERDLLDIETLLEIVASQPEYRASPWRLDDPKITKAGERGDAARVAAQMISSPPTRVPARVRALLRRHVAIVSR
jgi:Nucleotidyl transferase AbiEii toxin, Type IV TA system